MDFSSSEDIEAPLDKVFAELSDFDAIERQMLRRGVQVERRKDAPVPQAGMTWLAQFVFRGKSREATIELTNYTAPDHMEFTSRSAGLHVVTRIDCVRLSRAHTRITMTVSLKPRSLPARLMVQSMKLARAKLNRRFSRRMKEFAREFEKKVQSA